MFPRYLVLFTILMAGCIPYAFPTISMTPGVDLSDVKEEVHVFRVDIASMSGSPCYGQETFSFREVPLGAGQVPRQAQAGLDKGIIVIGVALNYHFHYHDGVEVRLYRPGYHLVQFKSWQLGKTIEWQPIKNITDREKAVDDLLAPTGVVDWCTPGRWAGEKGKSEDIASVGLRAGSYAADHRDVLLFAAGEYRRLAARNDSACSDEVRRRLLDKAEKVRLHAEK